MRLFLFTLTIIFSASAKAPKDVKVLKFKAKENLKKQIQMRKRAPLLPKRAAIKTIDVEIPKKDLIKHAKKTREIKERRFKHKNELDKLISSIMDKNVFNELLAKDKKSLLKLNKAQVSKFKKLKELIRTKETSFNQEITKYLYQDKELSLIRYKQISKILSLNPKFRQRYQSITKQIE